VDAKIGFWQDLYKGPMGRFVLGVELEYIKRYSFSGVGAAPSTDEVAFTSLRYYFQSRRTPSHTIIPNDPVCPP